MLNHLKNHTKRVCSACKSQMKIEGGGLPFGDALMTTWVCPQCKQEDITVIIENGKILELAS